MDHGKDIDQNSKKPEIIKFYTSSKSNVETLHQKCTEYNVGRYTRR